MSNSHVNETRSRFLDRLMERAEDDRAMAEAADRADHEFVEREAPPWDLSDGDPSGDAEPTAPMHADHAPSSDSLARDAALREIRARRRSRPGHRPEAASTVPAANSARPTPSRTAREAHKGADILRFRRRSPTARRVRRLRRHPLVRWLQPLAIAVLLVAVPAGVAAWTLRSPAFAVDEIRLSADSPQVRVQEGWIQAQLKELRGENLWTLDLDAPAETLRTSHWIRDVGIRKQPPATLVVRIVEKREAAIYDGDETAYFVDTEGGLVTPVDLRTAPQRLTVLRGKLAEPKPGQPSPELRAAVALLEEIGQAGTPWAAGLDQVEILSTRDFRVHTQDLPFPLLVRAGTVESRSRRLEQLLPWISELGRLRAVDLRFARRIIVEPAGPEAPPAPAGGTEAT